MRIEQRLRDGKDPGLQKHWTRKHQARSSKTNIETNPEPNIDFERYTKKFGSRILSAQGWKPGSGLGVWKEGIKEPLEVDGKKPRDKAGMGYYGEKLDRCIGMKRKAEKDVFIASIFDDTVDGEQQNSTRHFGPDVIKYRERPIVFKKQVDRK